VSQDANDQVTERITTVGDIDMLFPAQRVHDRSLELCGQCTSIGVVGNSVGADCVKGLSTSGNGSEGDSGGSGTSDVCGSFTVTIFQAFERHCEVCLNSKGESNFHLLVGSRHAETTSARICRHLCHANENSSWRK
jgi:hypothetical protein